eukprot:scpid72730/ scgid15828/ 
MKLAFTFVALLLAVICTHDESDVSALSLIELQDTRDHDNLHDAKSKETRNDDPSGDWRLTESLFDLLKSLTEPTVDEHEVKKRQAATPSPNNMMMSSSDDSMSMSMSSDDMAGGGAAGAGAGAGGAGAGGTPLMGQEDPELMLTGEMLRTLEEQVLGYSYSSVGTVSPVSVLSLLSATLLSMIAIYLFA